MDRLRILVIAVSLACAIVATLALAHVPAKTEEMTTWPHRSKDSPQRPAFATPRASATTR
jgi:hypothetical protein